MANSQFVQIRRVDDSLVNLEISQLRVKDQDWIRQRSIEIHSVIRLPKHDHDSIP
jgi:hypothetical protein